MLPFFLSLVAFGSLLTPIQAHWGLVIDAGSSGCRMRIYSWGQRPASTDPNITEFIPTNSTDAGLLENSLPISAYSSNPSGVEQALEPLLIQAKRWVPTTEYSKTPLILRATAGMRLLDTQDQNAIFAAIKTLFKTASKNPFKFQDSYATIASGEQEAVWSWVMANYVSGLLKADTPLTSYVSTLELGGASVQIDFIPTDELLSNEFNIIVFGKFISLYAHSFLQFGKDQFRDRARALAVSKQSPNTTITFPCFYTGYTDYWLYNNINYTFVGTSDWNSCYWNYTQVLMGLDVQCIQEPCSFMGVYQPRLPSNQTYWGISAYFYTLNGIGLVGWNAAFTGVVADIEPAGMAQCAKNWTKAQADLVGTNPAFIATYCLDSTLMISLLRAQGAETTPITYSRKSHGQTVGWPLGALIDELNLLPLDLNPQVQSAPFRRPTLLVTFLVALICISVLL